MVTRKSLGSQSASKELGKMSIFIELAGKNLSLMKSITVEVRKYLSELEIDAAVIKIEHQIEATNDGQKETYRTFLSLLDAPKSETSE